MKILYTILLFLFLQVSAIAQLIPDSFQARTDVALNPKNLKANQVIELKVFDTGMFSDILALKAGDIVKIKIIEYVPPKRGKRNGYYKIQYLTDEGPKPATMHAIEPHNFIDTAEGAAVGAAGHFFKVPLLSQAVAVSKGFVSPNEDQTRLESAGTNLYNSTPLKYGEKGTDFYVEAKGFVEIKVKLYD